MLQCSWDEEGGTNDGVQLRSLELHEEGNCRSGSSEVDLVAHDACSDKTRQGDGS